MIIQKRYFSSSTMYILGPCNSAQIWYWDYLHLTKHPALWAEVVKDPLWNVHAPYNIFFWFVQPFRYYVFYTTRTNKIAWRAPIEHDRISREVIDHPHKVYLHLKVLFPGCFPSWQSLVGAQGKMGILMKSLGILPRSLTKKRIASMVWLWWWPSDAQLVVFP